jgi:LysM repeat protein
MDLQLVKETMTPRFVAVLIAVVVAHNAILGTGFTMLRDNAAAPIGEIGDPDLPPPTTSGAPASTQGFETVPASGTPAAGTAATSTGRSHTVKPGESYWGIAKKYGITEDAIRAANGQARSHVIHPGDTLKIPN